MSSSIDNVVCPRCGGNALREQEIETEEVHIWCTEESCIYHSDCNGYEDEF